MFLALVHNMAVQILIPNDQNHTIKPTQTKVRIDEER
jgi:hypothetical protein